MAKRSIDDDDNDRVESLTGAVDCEWQQQSATRAATRRKHAALNADWRGGRLSGVSVQLAIVWGPGFSPVC